MSVNGKMQRTIFVDTSYIVALVNPPDSRHSVAKQLAKQFRDRPLLTTDVVLLEFGNALAGQRKRQAIGTIERFLSADNIEVVRLNPELFDKGFALYKARQDKAWGLVDCISFVVMQEAGVTQALTADRHFAQAGFEVLMDAGST